MNTTTRIHPTNRRTPPAKGGERGGALRGAPATEAIRSAPRLGTVGVLGLGAFVPPDLLRNADLERIVDTSDHWIRTRTGIGERHVVAPGTATSDLAYEAGRQALARAGLAPEELDLILLATATPDQPTPPTVCVVQHALGAVNAAGFDLNAACSGFVNALMTGHRLVASGAFRNALVIGADALSTITDYEDRETCVLFGDGAGAVLLGADAPRGEVLDHEVHLDGSGASLIEVPAGGSRRPTSAETVRDRAHFLRMKGNEVFRFAVDKLCELVESMTARHGIAPAELGLLVPHQANARILEAARKRLGIDRERLVSNVERFGNTSNASIPMALCEAEEQGRLEPGQHVMLAAFGGGLTWGASLLRW